LAYPIINRRDSQRAKLSPLSRLRDLYLPYRSRLIAILSQFGMQSIQLGIQVLPELLQALTIHTPLPRFALTHSQAISRFFFQPCSKVRSFSVNIAPVARRGDLPDFIEQCVK
jgi:hypothetical protein